MKKEALKPKKKELPTQFRVESTTELCLLEGPEGGIGIPLGKKLNICPWYRKPVSYFLGNTVMETVSSTIMVLPGLVAKLEPARSVNRNTTYRILHEIFLDCKGSDNDTEGAIWIRSLWYLGSGSRVLEEELLKVCSFLLV